ncbi:type II toxin-antitoxin system VapC family toxin [Allopusillimonas ginsengisoli]|uniref:type II toxin-antitoxin system VapC family toxin n=1 Tax=Allopusillimonas ginsengisoli TaxID=453575 RepID=UPI00101F1903|nr:type II toxin-antitoxin system VapC family toxin [Allopusillimonas ginsengisoli]TEA80136.1 type II toxin-antitoxin system VapC family toxin [Allopusillimonas ginsengisoli]
MSGYLLDTSIISALMSDPDGAAARHIERVGPQKICTSIIVAAELRYGCAKKGSAKLLARVESVLEVIPIIPLDIPADTEYGGIRAELEAAGKPIGANDLLIAAHASALGMTLVTANAREFERIRGLAVENWLE